MDISELVLECFSTLTLNKMRTGLAVLGIVIGIGSVIALISLGASSQKSIENQIQSLGANLLTVIPSGQNTGAVRGALGGGTTLTMDDAKALASANLPAVRLVSPEFSRRSQVTAGRNNTNTQITGVTPAYASVHKVELSSGVFISDSDQTNLAKVAVIGPQVAADLFSENPLDQSIRINNQILKVIGVTVSKGGTGFNNPDDAIYVPLSTAQKQLFGTTNLSTIAVEAVNQEAMTDAQDAVGYFLLARHHLSDPTLADFTIFSQNDILNTAAQVTGTFTTLLGGIAAISLLVGGIGIMNIMLVTVTERTREIGLRKALGAKKSLITTQFLLEAVILTLAGGVVGMVVGIIISYVLSLVLNTPFIVSPPSVLLAIGVSAIIGIVFGWYPARQAAILQPIEALRYE